MVLMAVNKPNIATSTPIDCSCICNLCDCNSIIATFEQQLNEQKASQKSFRIDKKRLEELQKENEQLKISIENLKSENQTLKDEIEELREVEDYNTGPNTPPSKLPLKEKMKSKKRSRKSGGRKKDQDHDTSTEKDKSDKTEPEDGDKDAAKSPGRPDGHVGSTSTLEPTEEIHDYVDNCHRCGSQLSVDEQVGTGAYTEVEIPDPIPVTITRHQTYKANCETCGHTSHSKGNLKGTSFGPNLAAMLTDLWYTGGVISLGKLSDIVYHLIELRFGEATIDKAIKLSADVLINETKKIEQQVLDDKHPNIDETSYTMVKKERSLGWIFVFATKDAVFYEFRDSRGGKFLKDLWDDITNVVPMVDGWQGYVVFKEKGRCWVHIIRECEELAKSYQIAVIVHQELLQLYHDIKTTRIKGSASNEKIQAKAKERLNKIISRLEDQPEKELQKFLTKLRNAEEHLLTPMKYEDMDMHNNRGERDIRPLVIHRKTRGKVSSDAGAKALMTIATFWQTCSLQGRNPRDELLQLLKQRSQECRCCNF